MPKETAIYCRVSTVQQSTRSQRADLRRWVDAQDPEKLGRVKWYEDKATGKNMDRPAWPPLQATIDAGQINRLVVWRLDRLGRTVSGLTKLFEDLEQKKVRLISLKDSIDLGTASGRLIANVLASVAAYETEIRGERVRAGQAVAKAAGKKWGGAVRGRRLSISTEQLRQLITLREAGEKMAIAARSTGISRRHAYYLWNDYKSGIIKLDTKKAK